MKSFGTLLGNARRAAGLSRRQLAERINVDVSSVTMLEQGAARLEKALLLKIFDALAIRDMGDRALLARAAGITLGTQAPNLPPEDMRLWLKQHVDSLSDAELTELFPALWLIFGKDP